MPFEDVQRVIYQKNPLIEVVFQVRIPKYLPIDTEAPAEFQKLVVGEYPIYEPRNMLQIVLGPSPQEAVGRAPSEMFGRMHAFTSADRNWSIQLSGDGLSLITRRYERWEDFKGRIGKALGAFLTTYQLPVLTRIGLRYQNVISRETLGLEGRPWSELLKPYISAEMSQGALDETEILARQTTVRIKLENDFFLLLRHGLVTHKETQKFAYLIDGDFFTEQQRALNLDDTLATSERLHTHSDRLFRWCITESLHKAMGPKPI
jgi:uncharacterized protein (TIGR04255 family)